MMLVVYHTTFYVPSPFTRRDPSTWSLASGAVKVDEIVSQPVALDDMPKLLTTAPAPSDVKAALRFS